MSMRDEFVVDTSAASAWAPMDPPASLGSDRKALRKAFRSADYAGADTTSKVEATRRPPGAVYIAEIPRRPASVTSSAGSVGTGYTIDGASGRRRAGGESSFKERATPVHDAESLSAQVSRVASWCRAR